MQHRNHACICGLQGVELTGTHPRDAECYQYEAANKIDDIVKLSIVVRVESSSAGSTHGDEGSQNAMTGDRERLGKKQIVDVICEFIWGFVQRDCIYGCLHIVDIHINIPFLRSQG